MNIHGSLERVHSQLRCDRRIQFGFQLLAQFVEQVNWVVAMFFGSLAGVSGFDLFLECMDISCQGQH